MKSGHARKDWKATNEDGKWKVRSSENRLIASVEKSGQDEADAKLLAASPIMFKALKSLVELISD